MAKSLVEIKNKKPIGSGGKMNLRLEKTEPKIVAELARGDAQQNRKTEAGTRLRKSFCSRLFLIHSVGMGRSFQKKGEGLKTNLREQHIHGIEKEEERLGKGREKKRGVVENSEEKNYRNKEKRIFHFVKIQTQSINLISLDRK